MKENQLIIDEATVNEVRLVILNSKQELRTTNQVFQLLRTLETLPSVEEPEPKGK